MEEPVDLYELTQDHFGIGIIGYSRADAAALMARMESPSQPHDCIYRGIELRRIECPHCPNKSVWLKVFGCSIFMECCIGKTADGIVTCDGCKSRVAFADPPAVK